MKDLIEHFINEHQYKLYGYIINRVKNETDADDIFQNTIEKAISKIDYLKDSDKVNSWILTICTNEISHYYRKKRQITDNIDSVTLSVEYEYRNFQDLLSKALKHLSLKNREVLELWFYTELSYDEIALACNLTAKTVKSRLYEARQHLKKTIPHLYEYSTRPESYYHNHKETVMMTAETRMTGSYVLNRLSLRHQVELCIASRNGEEFSKELLKEIGLIEKGKEFILNFHSRLLFKELIMILNYCDRHTERRLILELEKKDNETAEAIKKDMFVFEDLTLLEPELLKYLFSLFTKNEVITALTLIPVAFQEKLLIHLEEEYSSKIREGLKSAPVSSEKSAAAQQKIIDRLFQMDQEGELDVTRPDEGDPSAICIQLKEK